MKPVIFQIFGFDIYAYPVMLNIAFIIGAVYLAGQLKKEKIAAADLVVDLAIYVCIGAIVGARLVYVLLDWSNYKDNLLSIFYTRSGGLSFHGGFFGGLLAGIWYLRRKGESPWKFADLVAPYIPIGYAITRIGCFLNGCCYGVPFKDGRHFHWLFGWVCSEQDWAGYLHKPALSFLYRYPTQIYAIILNIVIFFLLWRQRKHGHFPGYLMFLYAFYYSIYRFIVEIFRDSQILFFGWLRTAQLASIIMAVLALLAIWFFDFRYKKLAVNTEHGQKGISG